VYISTLDPNPYVNGNGVAALREAGIEVETGFLSETAVKLNETYIKFIQTGLPFVHLKIAMSLDGRIAAASGDSKWITDRAARRRVHQLRHQYDAVLVGAETVRVDNPRLTVRLIEGRQPWRVVLSGRLDIPLDSEVLQDDFREKTIIFSTPAFDPQQRRAIEEQGVKVEIVKPDPQGRVDVQEVVIRLGQMGISSLLVEGGSRIFSEFIARQLFDKISFFLAPIIIGDGISAIGDLQTGKIAGALRLQHLEMETINDQILLQGYRNLRETFGSLTEAITCLPESSKNLAALP